MDLEILGYLPILFRTNNRANKNTRSLRIAWLIHRFLIGWHDVDVISVDGEDSFVAAEDRLSSPHNVFL